MKRILKTNIISSKYLFPLRSVALKSIIKEKENRLLTRKFEFEQNRGRSF
jgi:hypothetical protein